MEIEVLTYSKNLKSVLEPLARFYAKQLNLENSTYKLFVCTNPNLRKEGSNGLCVKTGTREITVALYSRLNPAEMLETLAHEMVHVKQFARGHYKNVPMKYGNGAYHYWMGKRVNKEYMARPWEIEAYNRQGILVQRLNECLSQKKGKKQKTN